MSIFKVYSLEKFKADSLLQRFLSVNFELKSSFKELEIVVTFKSLKKIFNLKKLFEF